MTISRSSFRTWWRDQVDYSWVVGFLESHSVLARMKLVIGGGGVLMLVNATLMILSPAGVRGVAGVTTGVLAAAAGAAWALRWWLLPWPREAESLAWIAVIDVVVAANSLMVQDRVLGALGIIMLVASGAYVAVFHGPRVLAVNVTWTMLAIVVLAGLMFFGDGRWHGDVALGIAVIIANLAVIGVVLPAVQLSHLLLRLDALSDPLTRLLNRRGLDTQLPQYFGEHSTGYMATIDLDRFKTVNDTYGHSFGDEVLKRIADRLRAAADSDALIARTGGEEFVVVGHVHDNPAPVVAERLRTAIETMSTLPIRITASVGVALFGESDAVELGTQHMLRCSDAAMYQAKHVGGNTVVIADTTKRVAMTNGRSRATG
ncbi:GGDEF domain-containing protein [Nocardia altamirensis]|uniref:GGDEF domain-containing protein n=1 Tax=Nocardia altamirensis TaxID=472158 RepID=UPI0009FD1DCD|nr:GGDEF domain-containing protein [Nocardia altamirensis]